MSLHTNQSGFSVVEVLVVALVLGLLVFGGYTAYNKMQDNKAINNTADQSAAASDVKAAPAINSTKDLDTAVSTLDQTDVSSASDSATLDTQLSGF
ncbi:MAG TPA: prepilin-type N-terminal cleavage/methylation domain-containing protein [Candidatus Pristimantibacillus sp.]|jgi:prepilin-type N-terminal cleavage/methylation domain-containing protein|nr:prepilin-type N-terminal cleavage/methylation domain-containing protein [Candidatus Pristimantibacillus sp.]